MFFCFLTVKLCAHARERKEKELGTCWAPSVKLWAQCGPFPASVTVWPSLGPLSNWVRPNSAGGRVIEVRAGVHVHLRDRRDTKSVFEGPMMLSSRHRLLVKGLLLLVPKL